MFRILIIEDDQELVDLLTYHLKDYHFDVSIAQNGLLGTQVATAQAFDLILLDINLPGKNGLDVCRDLRSQQLETPIMMLTARTDEVDRVIGLELGADDYVCKPFSIRELIARIRCVLRRTKKTIVEPSAETIKAIIQLGDIYIDIDKRAVKRNGEAMKLTPIEFSLLVLLASNPGKTYTKETLLSKVWGYDFNGFKHTVSSHINRLRTKLEPDPHDPAYILTTWGVGYRFAEHW